MSFNWRKLLHMPKRIKTHEGSMPRRQRKSLQFVFKPMPSRQVIKATILNLKRLKLGGVWQLIKSLRPKNFKKAVKGLARGNSQLSRKIIVPMVALIVVTVGFTGYISYTTAKDNIQQIIQQRLRSEAEKMTEKFSTN